MEDHPHPLVAHQGREDVSSQQAMATPSDERRLVEVKTAKDLVLCYAPGARGREARNRIHR
jgi:hypothetical protein